MMVVFQKVHFSYKAWARIIVVAIICIFLVAISPLARLYTMAYLGSSEAMYCLGKEYLKIHSDIILRPSGYRGAYWLRRSAKRGNLHAIGFIERAWCISDPKEVVQWLHKGVEFGHPWCAEQLAIGYKYGLYGLPRDKEKEAEYRQIGLRLRAEGKGSRYD
jgi:TPR repeat protein